MMNYHDPFTSILDELEEMHDRKGRDYGTGEDPYANVRQSQEFGIEPWVGALVRANDKVKRLQKAARGGTLSNEGVEDSLLDLAVYAIIGLILFRDSKPLDGWIDETPPLDPNHEWYSVDAGGRTRDEMEAHLEDLRHRGYRFILPDEGDVDDIKVGGTD